MIALLFSGICTFLLCSVGGYIITDFLKWKTNRFDEFFLGLAAVNAYFTIYSIFHAISAFSAVALLIAYALYFSIRRLSLQNLIEAFQRFTKRPLGNKPFYILLFILCSPVLISLDYTGVYDTGLYHTQAVQWITDYRAVPGLANLHSRFGFNPNIFSLFAATSFTPLFQQPIYSVNLCVFSVFVLWVMTNMHSAYTFKKYNLMLRNSVLLGFVYPYCVKHASLPTPDVVPMIILCYILLRFVETEHDQTASGLLFILCIYAVTLKLSAVPILLIAAILSIQYKFYKPKLNHFMILALSLLIVLPWMIRGIIYTGWLVYPFSSIDLFSFDWKVPTEQVKNLHMAITGSARHYDPKYYEWASQTSYWEWIQIWLKKQDITDLLLLFGSLFIPLALLILTCTKKLQIQTNLSLALLTSLLGILFWFVTAPDFRFGLPFIAICFILPMCLLKPAAAWGKISHGILFILIPTVLLVELGSFVFQNARHFPKPYFVPNKMERMNDQRSVDFNYFWIDGKVKCFYPVIGDRCFDMTLPCTKDLKNDLHLRGKGIENGFRTVNG